MSGSIWTMSEKQRIFGRFSFADSTVRLNAFGNMWDLFYAQNITNARNVLLADDYTFNPNTVLQVRYSFTRHYENQTRRPATERVRHHQPRLSRLARCAQQNYKTLPYVIFDDVGGGIGGTANWNTFQYASENSDIIASVTRCRASTKSAPASNT